MKNLQNHPGSSLTLKNELKMLKKETPKTFWFFTKFKKCAKNRRKISLNILGLISRIETELRRPSSFKEYPSMHTILLIQMALST